MKGWGPIPDDPDLAPNEHMILKEPGEIEELWWIIGSMVFLIVGVPLFIWWLTS